MKNFRYVYTFFVLCAALISGGVIQAWAQPPKYIPSPIDPSSFPEPSPEVVQMLKQWERPFIELKSLQLNVKAFLSNPKDTTAKQQLLVEETFAYDNPKFREDLTLFKDGVVANKSYGKTTFSYDGHYYYSAANGPAPGGHTMRAPKVDASWPVTTLNPLAYLFQFVINGTDPKLFSSLTKSSVWDAFARRITDFKKDAQTGEVTFSCKNYDSKFMPTSTYQVKAALVDDVLVPVSLSQIDPVMQGTVLETAVTDFDKDAKSTFGMPFPMRITVADYKNGVLIPQAQSAIEVDAKSFTINQPVIATFTLKDDSMMSVDSLGLPPEKQ